MVSDPENMIIFSLVPLPSYLILETSFMPYASAEERQELFVP